MSVGDVAGIVFGLLIGIGIWIAVGYGVWRIAQMKPSVSTVGSQIHATRAILKFCLDHGDDRTVWIGHIRDCLQALESGDRQAAIESYRRISWRKDGFADWWPPVVFEHENEEYVTAVFMGLCETWSRLMELLCKGRGVS